MRYRFIFRNKCVRSIIVYILLLPIILLIFLVLFIISTTNNTDDSRFERIILNKIDQFGTKSILSANNSIRRNYTKNIGIFVGIERRRDLNKYRTAINTLECYAAMHRYSLVIVYGDEIDKKIEQKCQHILWFFKRHCIASEHLINYDWLLCLDADIGVVNPLHLIEEYIDERVNLIFYDRGWIWEIVTGSYLVKNSQYSRNFLSNFANIEPPNSYHGYDNGAIHTYLVRELLPNAGEYLKYCDRIWRTSKAMNDLAVYEACCRAIIGENRLFLDRVKLLERGHAWSRDIYLTSGLWSNRDFMLHAWKEENFQSKINITHRLRRPIIVDLNIVECRDRRIDLERIWIYDETLIVDDRTIATRLSLWHADVVRMYWRSIGEVYKYSLDNSTGNYDYYRRIPFS